MTHPSQDWIMENEVELVYEWFKEKPARYDEFYEWAEQEYNDRQADYADYLADMQLEEEMLKKHGGE